MTQAQQPRNSDTNDINNFSGGLNTTSLAGSFPVGDSPLMQNVIVTDRGSAKTRKGTYTNAILDNVSSEGCVVLPYQTRAGNVFLITKQNRDIVMYSTKEFKDQEITATEVIRKAEVWDENGARVRPDYVITNENVSRVIMTTGVNAPVQLTLVEGNTIASGNTVNSFQLKSPYFEAASLSNVVAICNGIVMPVSSLSFTDGVITVNLTGLYDLLDVTQNPFGYSEIVCDFIFVTWQWMCQADVVSGDKLYETVTRFNTNEADKTVAVPTSLLKNIQPLEDDDVYPILVYTDNLAGSYYTYKADLKPTLETEFAWSGGIFYNSAAPSTISPNFSHITFGALEASGTPSEVHFVRAFSLASYSDKNNKIDADFLTVRVNGYESVITDTLGIQTDSSPSVTNINTRYAYIRRDRRDNSVQPFNSFSSRTIKEDFDFVSLDGANNFGLSGSDVVEYIYSNPANIGSNANANILNAFFLSADVSINLFDGYATPLYGIQEHADYGKGSFPRCVYFYQGRLVFGGFSLDPTRVVTSEVKDTSVTGFNFQNFSSAWGEFQTFEPVMINIAGESNESVVSSITESSGSMIVFTRSQCYRVYGGNTALAPLSVVVSRISSLGCVNPQSSVTIDNAVYFLSESGMYRLSPSIEVGDFAVTLYSRKIQDSLKAINNFRHAYMTYDKKRSVLYIGVATDKDSSMADKLYVFNVNQNSFYEYRHFTQTWLCASACSENLVRDSYVFFVCGLPNNNNLYIISHPYFYHTDFSTASILVEETTEPSGSGFITITTTTMSLPHSKETGSYNNSMIQLEKLTLGDLSNLKDGFLKLNGTEASFGTDWFKHDNKTILLNVEEQSGTFEYYPIDYREKYPLMVFVNDVLIDSSNYGIVFNPVDGDLYDLEFNENFLSNVDRPRSGYAIPYVISTPQYIRGTLTGKKFADDINLLLDNREFREIYTSLIDPTVGDIYKNVLGSWKIQVNLNIMRYMGNDELFGQATVDLFGSSLMTWDDLNHDYQPTRTQFKEFAKVRASPKGSDDIVQMFVQTFSNFGFEIIAYDTSLSRNRRG